MLAEMIKPSPDWNIFHPQPTLVIENNPSAFHKTSVVMDGARSCDLQRPCRVVSEPPNPRIAGWSNGSRF
jgi:hypothetical protein